MIIILRGRVSVGQEGEQTGSTVRPQSVQVHGMWWLLDVEGFHYPPVCKVGFDLLYCSRLLLHLVSGVPCVDCYTSNHSSSLQPCVHTIASLKSSLFSPMYTWLHSL